MTKLTLKTLKTYISEQFQIFLILMYDLNWVDYPVILRKKLVYFMMALRRPVVLTLGKFTVLNTEFYLAVSQIF